MSAKNGQIDLNDQKMEKLVELAAQKMGMNKNDLKKQLQGDNLNKITGNLKPDQQQQLNALLQNPELAKKMLESPAAKAVLTSLLGGK